ncbi:MAG: DUF4139 domain-containing protein [Planctomycetota bacterium]|jgi:hypothetical protein
MHRPTLITAAAAVLGTMVAAAAPAAAQDGPRADLQVRKVVLYKHGVGYFEREGKVEGAVTVPLAFKTSQMPDVLKSLFAVHTAGRGRIESIVYDSKDPLAKQLADIMVDVPDGNALTAFLRRLKGARVEVTVGAQAVRGHVMGIEPVSHRGSGGVTTRYKLVLLGEDGVIRPLELLDASGVRVLDPALQRDLQRMMEIYAKARHADRKTVELRSVGAGARTLRVGYIIEQPIWKTSYRLIFDEGEQPLLQGWAIVENRTDEDWSDVDLTFVAGSPLSFLMDLYTSYYPTRPVVGVQAAEGLELKTADARRELKRHMERLSQSRNADRDARKKAGWGPAGGAAFADDAEGAPAEDPGALGKLLAASLAPAAAGAEAGELFAYNSRGKVSIKRGQAALVPILLEPMEGGARVLYYRADLSRHPQHAFYLENSSALTLEKGPITVFEGSTCQGESLLTGVLKPKMKAMLPYAVETAVEVDSEVKRNDQPVSKMTLVRGVLRLERTRVHETRYTVREKSGTARVCYVDHPRIAGTTRTAPVEAAETLPAHYRFKVEVKASGSATLVVREQAPQSQSVQVRNLNLDQIRLVLRQPGLSEGAAGVLRQAIVLMEGLAKATQEQRQAAAERKRLSADQERIRRTLDSFSNSTQERAMRDQYLKRLVASDERIDELDASAADLAAQVQRINDGLAKLLNEFADK